MDEIISAGTPSLCMAGELIACGTVSKAFDISSWTTVIPNLAFAALRVSFRMWTLLKHPDSCTKPFYRGEKIVRSLSLWSIIPQYNLEKIDPISVGR